jgi:alanyl-tRNA synthetase
MNSRRIRTKFFDFFSARNHTKVASSSLIPAEDPTLLFANAGMNQFKDLFLGKTKRSYTRAVSIQKCIRAGGKHNDLENVGFTRRHLTFFEMMGNFSFGDYFKKEAIRYAWDFLTQEVGLPAEKLYASVYSADDEAYEIWHREIGLPENRIVRLGAADNFWQMGDTGPCGPCTEIYVDRGSEHGCKSASCAPGCSCDRFLEVWNNVFMQFDRQPDGTDIPLKQTGVDTGMGLERLCAIVQEVESVYETDLFMPIIQKVEALTGIAYAPAPPDLKGAFRVLADHTRSATCAIADGCSPSNEGRGYVLRKIVRRAALFNQKLSDQFILPELVDTVISILGTEYPDLITSAERIKAVIASEGERFIHNLAQGQVILAKYLDESDASTVLSGEHAFKLYDTYGFPLELTKVVAHERGYTVDDAGFEREMERQRIQSGKKEARTQQSTVDATSVFTGYDETETRSRITHIICGTTSVDEVPAGERCVIVVEHTPFYRECGGQVSDTGTITGPQGVDMRVEHVVLTGSANGHEILTGEPLAVGMEVALRVDAELRKDTMRNHTATHLLQAALMELLGKGVKQSGSLVSPDYLRFDFTYHDQLSPEQIIAIERRVNEAIRANIQTRIATTTYSDALSRGVIAFFGEKYNPEAVRVVEVPGFSAELCGGTHVAATGDIGIFKITEISALSAGNRRIVAVTGRGALALFQQSFATIKTLATELKVPVDQVDTGFARIKAELTQSIAALKNSRKELVRLRSHDILATTEDSGLLKFGSAMLQDMSGSDLRELATILQQKRPGFYVLIATGGPRDQILCSASNTIAQKISMKDFGTWLTNQGIQGGGSGLMVQGTGTALGKELIAQIRSYLQEQIV